MAGYVKTTQDTTSWEVTIISSWETSVKSSSWCSLLRDLSMTNLARKSSMNLTLKLVAMLKFMIPWVAQESWSQLQSFTGMALPFQVVEPKDITWLTFWIHRQDNGSTLQTIKDPSLWTNHLARAISSSTKGSNRYFIRKCKCKKVYITILDLWNFWLRRVP